MTASIVMNGIRDVKQTRDTIVVTGSAKQPIQANLAEWFVSVSSHERSPAEAARSVRAKTKAVDAFLRDAGLASDVKKPPVDVQFPRPSQTADFMDLLRKAQQGRGQQFKPVPVPVQSS